MSRRRLRNGEELIVVNAERAIVSGNRSQLLEMYGHRRHRAQQPVQGQGPEVSENPGQDP